MSRSYLLPRVESIVSAQQMSILLEVSGEPKPGNVTRHRAFPEISYDDFAFAAASIHEPLTRSYERARATASRGRALRGLWGKALLESCRKAMSGRSNTIFGTLLVEIPLGLGASVVASGESMTQKAASIVHASDFSDSLAFVKSIRVSMVGNLAHPAFMPSDEALDVEDPLVEEQIRESKVGLERLLAPSAGYDLLASELVGGFPIISRYASEFVAWLRKLEDPIKASAVTYCSLLAKYPDSLIRRKAGVGVAEDIMGRAERTMRWRPFSAKWIQGMEGLDEELRSEDLNPGTLADLTAGSIFLALLGGPAIPGE